MPLSPEERKILAQADLLKKRERETKANQKVVEAQNLLALVKGTMAFVREGMNKMKLTPGAKFTIECRQKDEGLEIIAKRVTVKNRGQAIYITAQGDVTDAEGFSE